MIPPAVWKKEAMDRLPFLFLQIKTGLCCRKNMFIRGRCRFLPSRMTMCARRFCGAAFSNMGNSGYTGYLHPFPMPGSVPYRSERSTGRAVQAGPSADTGCTAVTLIMGKGSACTGGMKKVKKKDI